MPTTAHPCEFTLRYASLRDGSRCFAFPCDRFGRTDLDAMSERVRNDYFAARALVGRDVAPPVIELNG